MKYFCYFLVLVCCACRKEIPLRMSPLYRELENMEFIQKVDSVISISRKFDPAERYAIICRALNSCERCLHTEIAVYYRKELNALSFPEINNKESGFLLLEQYAYGGNVAQKADLNGLSLVLSDMENRFRLTPEERCNYLTLKSGIYLFVFKEYEVSNSISEEAVNLAGKLNFSGEELYQFISMQLRCCMRMQEPKRSIDLIHNFLESSENRLEAQHRQVLYSILMSLYFEQDEYEKAYICMVNSTKTGYSDICVGIYLRTNRITELMSYLDEQLVRVNEEFKENGLALSIYQCKISWARARAYLLLGDTDKYKSYLYEAVRSNDRRQIPGYGKEEIAFSEAYVRLLWEQGRREEAVHRMEKLSQLLQRDGLHPYKSVVFNGVEEKIKQFRLLLDYYIRMGRTSDAHPLLELYDSLQVVHTDVRLNEEKLKNKNNVYMADLHRNLDMRIVAYEQERQKRLFTIILLGLALVLVFIFARLYYWRQKELNHIYARQKEMEGIEALMKEKEETAGELDKLPADKQLYLHLQKQLYENKLFLRPDFSRNDLCRLGGSNRMYVSTCINKYAGMNLNQWINKARINYTINLIHSGKTDLKELARNSGFSSTSAFYRNFKYFTLLSPKQYIERETK